MTVEIKNQYLTAKALPFGAELASLADNQTGTEYIWPAHPAFWNRHAPILFPIVGEVANGTLHVDGNPYTMGRHGFARNSMFEVSAQRENAVSLTLKSSPATKAQYPYDFVFTVTFTLEGRSLITTFTIENPGDKTLHFSVGGHPAFNLPTKNLSDYVIEFARAETQERFLLADNLFSGQTEPVLNNSSTLPLNTELFDKDAIIFKSLKSTSLELKNKNGQRVLTCDYTGFPQLGIWTKPNCNEFICLEPWCGFADSEGYTGDFSQKPGNNALAPGGIFERSFTVGV